MVLFGNDWPLLNHCSSAGHCSTDTWVAALTQVTKASVGHEYFNPGDWQYFTKHAR